MRAAPRSSQPRTGCDHGCCSIYTHADDTRPAHSAIKRCAIPDHRQVASGSAASAHVGLRHMRDDGFPKPVHFGRLRQASGTASHRHRAVGTLEGGGVMSKSSANKVRTARRSRASADAKRSPGTSATAAVKFLWSLPTEKVHVTAIHPDRQRPKNIKARTFPKS